MGKAGTAYLSNIGRYTRFEFEDECLLFIAPKPLERYLSISTWDNGYIVVQAKYSIYEHPIEEYIDLVPILRNLYMDPTNFCSRITCVEVRND